MSPATSWLVVKAASGEFGLIRFVRAFSSGDGGELFFFSGTAVDEMILASDLGLNIDVFRGNIFGSFRRDRLLESRVRCFFRRSPYGFREHNALMGRGAGEAIITGCACMANTKEQSQMR